jgi:hypothetical protein
MCSLSPSLTPLSLSLSLSLRSRLFVQFNTAVRKAFVQLFDFSGMKLVDALR